MNSCNVEPTDKKAFGIAIYKRLRETYGVKDHYDVAEIEQAVRAEGYPEAWECWALVAFMLPANVGEYFRSRETPMDVLGMKRSMIREMTDGQRDTLSVSSKVYSEYEVEIHEFSKLLTHRSLVNYFAARAGYNIGHNLASDLMGI